MRCFSIFVICWLNLLSIAEGACDGNACCFDSDCGRGRYCPRGGGHACKCKSEWFKSKWGYGSCVTKLGIGQSCGTNSNCASNNCMNGWPSKCPKTCGRSNEGGHCDEDSDCAGSSMFCKGGQTGVSCGKCTKKLDIGGSCTSKDDCKSNNCMNTFASKCPKTCGPSYEGGHCDEDSDCAGSSMFCKGGQTSVSCGKCTKKIDIGGSCTTKGDCKSNNCMNGWPSKCPKTCGPSYEGGHCDEDSDCAGSSMFCKGGQTGLSCGKCTKKLDIGGSCTAKGDCKSNNCMNTFASKCPKTCGPSNEGGHCDEDSDCAGSSMFCKGGQTGVSCGKCTKKLDNGRSCTSNDDCKSGDCMNAVGSKCPRTCGPSNEGGHCDEDSDCAGSSMFCKGGQTGLSCGKCTKKLGNGETCTANSDCNRNDCRGIRCGFPGSIKTCLYAYCYESPGFPVGHKCTEDRDCDQSKAWCDGGGAATVGTCRQCPAKCGDEGCNACNNDKTKMMCGRTTDLVKATCAATVAEGIIAEAFECLGFEGAGNCLATAVKSAGSCLTGGSCEIKFGYPTCDPLTTKKMISGELTDSRRLRAEDSLVGTWGEEEADSISEDFGLTEHLSFEGRKLSAKPTLTSKGTLGVSGGFLFTLDPKQGKMKFQTKLIVAADALATFTSTSNTANSKRDRKGKPAGPKKTVFSKFFMVGKFPVQMAVTVQPFVWVDYTTKGKFTASVSVKKTATMTGSLTVSGLFRKVETELKWTKSPLTTTVKAAGTFDASFTYRLGVRVGISFNGFKTSADAAFALQANANLKGEANLQAASAGRSNLQNGCLHGTFGVGASADVSANVNFEAPNPKAAAAAACLAGVELMMSNPVGAVANCVAKLITGKDAKQKLQDMCSDIDSDPVRNVPESTCTAMSASSYDGKWTSFPLVQTQLTVQGLCSAADASPIAKTTVSNIFTGCKEYDLYDSSSFSSPGVVVNLVSLFVALTLMNHLG